MWRKEDTGEGFQKPYKGHEVRTFESLEKKGLVTTTPSKEPFLATGRHLDLVVVTEKGEKVAKELIEKEGWTRKGPN
jgi:DNA-binding MarR family transcriptional regulator